MVSYTIFVSIDHLRLKDNNPPFQLNHLTLSDDAGFPKSWVSSDVELLKKFGEFFLGELLSNPFLFTKIDEDYFKEYSVTDIAAFTKLDVITIEWFFFFSWLVKDNSINVGNYFVQGDNGRYVMRDSKLRFSNCHGLFEDVVFTKQELDQSLELFSKLILDISKTLQFEGKIDEEAAKEKGIQSSGINERPYNNHNRITRAFLFIHGARSTTLLPVKISFYIGALECLFSITDGEITHKVAERVSSYMVTDFAQRVKLFKQIKKLYDIRSKFMHGQILPKGSRTSEELMAKSSEIDEILRKVLNKIIAEHASIFIGEDEKLDEFFLGLMFN